MTGLGLTFAGLSRTSLPTGFSGTMAAAGLALAVNLAVFLAAAWAVRLAARRYGPATAARVLVWSSLPRMALVLGLGVAAAWAIPSLPRAFWFWLAGLYVVCALAVVLWVARWLGLQTRPRDSGAAR